MTLFLSFCTTLLFRPVVHRTLEICLSRSAFVVLKAYWNRTRNRHWNVVNTDYSSFVYVIFRNKFLYLHVKKNLPSISSEKVSLSPISYLLQMLIRIMQLFCFELFVIIIKNPYPSSLFTLKFNSQINNWLTHIYSVFSCIQLGQAEFILFEFKSCQVFLSSWCSSDCIRFFQSSFSKKLRRWCLIKDFAKHGFYIQLH